MTRTTKFAKGLTTGLVAFWLWCGPCLADIAPKSPNMQGDPTEQTLHRAEEFFSEEVPGEQLISVQLLGAVERSGVYHVPKTTDVVRLVALAGGTRVEADLRKVAIKRRNKPKEEVLLVNIQDVAEKEGVHSALLEAGDVVLVYAKEPIVDRDTLTLITVITSLLSVLTSVFVLGKAL